ncbi:SAM-dependent methyltransferase (plasmid) [Phormidium sp. CLA17]|uniref:SAM-dependent methyltransferase n=1 Tax=Leptolyngbya sp. Cla-17 TaxID=2803751 RepID=UPI0019325C6A|nr:tetratricopeptide repeat protein [Leptolyngbya sp. Cla-17]MBM0745610.1 SAM-dependent methyltransferase [Leptolyngbya sp. Cla-17]
MPPRSASCPILETNQPLSQSLLWQFQRHFFAQQGINAWNQGTVPHYVTSNPFIANAYAKVVFGFLRDWHPMLDPNHPIYILELGAGSGRFAYHFLKKFWDFFPHSTLRHLPVKYILADFSDSTLNYWRTHPFLQPYFQQGILDIAHFDAQHDQTLNLHFANQTHTTLKNPLIVLANYFFDCLPQDVFTLKQHQLHASLVTLSLPDNSKFKIPFGSTQASQSVSRRGEQNSNLPLNDPNLIHQINVTYTDRPITSNYYTDLTCNQILSDYQHHLTDTALLFPIVGLNCIRNLHHLSQNRLLFLSGDKGYSKLEDLQNREKPQMVFHGNCFSLMVNYHAIGQYVIYQGGQALHTPHHHTSLNISAFLLGNPPTNYAETRHAYQDAIINHSPDDFFSLKRAIEPNCDRLTLQQAIAYIRLSGWDANIFLACLPTLLAHAKSASDTQCQELIQLIHNVWDTYYPISEAQDLAFQLGKLLIDLQDYRTASKYFQQSLKLQGLQPKTLHYLSQCYHHLGETEAALYCIHQT